MTTLLQPEQLPTIVDQTSLEHAWRVLMGELGFGAPQLWVMLLASGRARQLMKIDDVPLAPEAPGLIGLQKSLRALAASPTDVAFLYCRPGPAGWLIGDRHWAAGLAGLFPGGWPVHLANDHELRVVAPDDLVASS